MTKKEVPFSVQAYMTFGVDICGATMFTKSIVLASDSISGVQALTLQMAFLPIAQTADKLPPSCISFASSARSMEDGEVTRVSCIFRRLYVHSLSFQLATASVKDLFLVRSQRRDPMYQRSESICQTDSLSGKCITLTQSRAKAEAADRLYSWASVRPV